MFITRKDYLNMKEMIKKQDIVIEKYIKKNARLKSYVHSLRDGIIHAMVYLKDYQDSGSIGIACDRLRTTYIVTLDDEDEDTEFAKRRMPDEWKEFLKQYNEWKEECSRA